jgi:hypothetical protein
MGTVCSGTVAFCTDLYLKAGEFAKARHSGKIRVGDILKAVEVIKKEKATQYGKLVEEFIKKECEGNATEKLKGIARLYTYSTTKDPRKKKILEKLGRVLLHNTDVMDHLELTSRFDLRSSQESVGLIDGLIASTKVFISELIRSFDRKNGLSKKQKELLSNKVALYEQNFLESLQSSRKGKTADELCHEIEENLHNFVENDLNLESVPKEVRKKIEAEVYGFAQEIERSLKAEEKHSKLTLVQEEPIRVFEGEKGTLQIGDVLRFVNWITPEYKMKGMRGTIEIENLVQLSRVLRAGGPKGQEETARIAHAIKDWSSFAALPLQVRAAVRYATQKESSPLSYRQVCVRECFNSLKRFFTLKRVSGSALAKELERAVGDSLAALKGNAVWAAFQEGASDDDGKIAKALAEINRLTQISGEQPGWKTLLTDEERDFLKVEHERIMQEKKEGYEKKKVSRFLEEYEKEKEAGFLSEKTKSLAKEIVDSPAEDSSRASFAIQTGMIDKSLLSTEVKKEIERQIKDPESEFSKQCLREAEGLFFLRTLEILSIKQDAFDNDFAVLAKKVLEKHAENTGATLEEVEEQLRKDPLWQQTQLKLEDTFLIFNDKLRMNEAKKGQEGLQPVQLTKSEKSFLRREMGVQRAMGEKRGRDRDKALLTAGKVAGVFLVTTLAIGTAPIWLSILTVMGLFGMVFSPAFTR